MSRVIKFFETIRNNWKKSVVGAAAFTYGVSYSIENYDNEQLMRRYSEEAARYGDEPLRTNAPPRRVTVILNPVAGNRNAKKLFEKYCEPLLHLAGIAVTIIQTEKESQARSLIENLETRTDAIIVAGGDGTLSDVVTGLMRKYRSDIGNVKKCPIGILPLGKTNRTADSLFRFNDEASSSSSSSSSSRVVDMAEAAMAVVRGNTKAFNVAEVEPLQKDPENDVKPVYAVGEIEWGAWRDAQSRLSNYWYWGFLNKYITYVFTGYKNDVNWDCNAIVRYSEPCHGCSSCYDEQRSTDRTTARNRRWWQAFLPTKIPPNTAPDYSKITNESCSEIRQIPISVTELYFTTGNVEKENNRDPPSIRLHLGPERVSYGSYVTEGWRRVRGEKPVADRVIQAKHIELVPKRPEHLNEQMFYIDNEEFELKPLKIRLLPQSVTLFCPRSGSHNVNLR